ncbi:MAG: hypothetical protein DIZ78_09360 [endosymbiont of Escarpia spicata]|uniref:Uncharacterized protein n=1 Tax=endosymbiont of Escarpia spicata TaxID=2200908 RepID=A0A370DPY8_9GAMM|nr:MAG: hypothetical protein DIZ78_09360 [endosymbiont of Escarpia spicata]
MFQFAEKREVLWPVIIGAPSADGSGRIDEFTIKVRFSLLGRDEAKSMRGGANDEFIASEDFETLLKSHVHGWEDYKDQRGTERTELNAQSRRTTDKIGYDH